MSDQSGKKDREKYLLERFLYEMKMHGSIGDASEPPDFEVTFEDRRIGVEVTEVFQQNQSPQASLRAVESLSNRILRRAKQEYERLGGHPVQVSVLFFNGPDLRSIQRDAASLALADLVHRLHYSEDGLATWDNNYKSDQDLNIFAHVRCFRVPNKSMTHWCTSSAGWAATLEESQIVERVSAKNIILPKYRSKFAENWLLVALDGGSPSQFFDLDALQCPLQIQHDFDQAYFFRAFPTKIIPIKP